MFIIKLHYLGVDKIEAGNLRNQPQSINHECIANAVEPRARRTEALFNEKVAHGERKSLETVRTFHRIQRSCIVSSGDTLE